MECPDDRLGEAIRESVWPTLDEVLWSDLGHRDADVLLEELEHLGAEMGEDQFTAAIARWSVAQLHRPRLSTSVP
jgi:hypothetical protein